MRFLPFLLVAVSAWAQGKGDGIFRLALPAHSGQLLWKAQGFQIAESSVKPKGTEIGLRGTGAGGAVSFLGFLFLFPEQAPMTSEKCRDGVMEPEKKENKSLRIVRSFRMGKGSGSESSVVEYTETGEDGKSSTKIRAFVAEGDLCGDLYISGTGGFTATHPAVAEMLDSFRLDTAYQPQFGDIFLYAQMLYRREMYEDAGPIFELALAKIKQDKSPGALTQRRVVTDQAGMSYGISGNIAKSRAIFQAAIAEDAGYPLYYYNLACGYADEGKLDDARRHLEQAFARAGNTVPGETVPDPSTDDSFLKHRSNKEFWKFVLSLKQTTPAVKSK